MKPLTWIHGDMQDFRILFDDAEPSSCDDPAYAPYGNLGFPASPPDRPWIYSNFVQSLDGIVSFKGRHPTGADISQLPEDRWLMDLLRAHADAILLGINTLIEETQVLGGGGPVYMIDDPSIRALRSKLGLGKEKNIFVTGAASVDPSQYQVFDSDLVETYIVTTNTGAQRLRERSHSRAAIIVAGQGNFVDLAQAMRLLRKEHGINRLLCEGGPTLYGYMSRGGLIDEKFLTIAPIEVGLFVPPEQEPSEMERSNPPKERPTTFMAPGFIKENAPRWRWMSCRRVGEHQFDRYRRIW